MVGVRIGPPNVLGPPKPMSSISTITTLGAASGALTSNHVGGLNKVHRALRQRPPESTVTQIAFHWGFSRRAKRALNSLIFSRAMQTYRSSSCSKDH